MLAVHIHMEVYISPIVRRDSLVKVEHWGCVPAMLTVLATVLLSTPAMVQH